MLLQVSLIDRDRNVVEETDFGGIGGYWRLMEGIGCWRELSPRFFRSGMAILYLFVYFIYLETETPTETRTGVHYNYMN